MSTCKQWAVPEGFFRGLCSNTYEPLQGTDECPVCVTPTIVPGVCSLCGPKPPYAVKLTINGAFAAHNRWPGSFTSQSPAGSYDNNTWDLLNVSSCAWESEEYEMCVASATNNGAVVLSPSVSGCCSRKRFRLELLGKNQSTGVLSWRLFVRFNTVFSAGSIRQHEWSYNSTSNSCTAPMLVWKKQQHYFYPPQFFPTQTWPTAYGQFDLYCDLSAFIRTEV